MKYFLTTTLFLIISTSSFAQSDFAEKADSLYNKMLFYSNYENYKKAAEEQAQLVELLKNSNEKEIYTNQLSALAILYQQNEEYGKAIRTFKLTIENIKKIWGKEIEFLAQNYAGLSIACIANKQFEDGKTAYKNADTIFKKVEIESLVDYLDILYAIRNDLQLADKYEEDDLQIAALEDSIAKKVYGAKSIKYAETVADIGNAFVLTGRYALGYPYLLASYTIYKKNKEYYTEPYIEITGDLALYYTQIGNYLEVERLVLEQLSTAKKHYGDSALENVSIYNQLGKLYFEVGNYAKSEESMLTAIEIIEFNDKINSEAYVNSLSNLGGLYYTLGNTDKAFNYTLKAEYILKKIGIESTTVGAAKIQEGLGLLHIKIGSYDKAKIKLIKAIGIIENLIGNTNPALAPMYANLSQAYYSTNTIDSVIWCLQKSTAIIENTYTPNQYGYEKALNHKKNIYYFKNQPDSVLLMAEKSLVLIENTVGKKHPEYGRALYQLAESYAKINHPQTGYYIQQAIAEDKRKLRDKLTFLSGNELLEYINEQLYDAHRLLAWQAAKQKELSSDLFNHLLLLKGASLQYSNTILTTVKNSKDTSIQKTYNRLSLLKNLLAKEYTKANSKVNTLAWEVKADELEKQLVKKTSAYRNLDALFSTNWKSIQEQLKNDEVAIEFFRYDEWFAAEKENIKYGALVLGKNDKLPAFITLFDEEQLKAVLGKISPKQMFKTRSNELLGEVQSQPAYYGDTLYQLIWKPLEKHLKNKKTIYLSPDGVLHQVAFNALPINDSTLLIDKYRSVQLLSLKEIKKQNSNAQLKSIALFGGIEYDADKNLKVTDSTNNFLPKNRGTTSSFNYLQGTLNETKSIQKLLKQTQATITFYSGKAGTEEQFKQLDGNAPQVLHLATHGFFIEEQKKIKTKGQFGNGENAFTVANDPLMRGGLILAGGNRAWQGLPTQKGKEDGVVTALEVAGLDLSNTELVVLSACQTGLGDVKETEGVYGLQRAFKMAGAKQLIMSLWSVPDKETQELMELFYRELIKTNNTRKAFENAQKTMRTKYAPYYWAAFVLVE